MKLGLVVGGIQRCSKLFSGFITCHLILGKWGLEQKEEKAHLRMSFKNMSQKKQLELGAVAFPPSGNTLILQCLPYGRGFKTKQPHCCLFSLLLSPLIDSSGLVLISSQSHRGGGPGTCVQLKQLISEELVCIDLSELTWSLSEREVIQTWRHFYQLFLENQLMGLPITVVCFLSNIVKRMVS